MVFLIITSCTVANMMKSDGIDPSSNLTIKTVSLNQVPVTFRTPLHGHKLVALTTKPDLTSACLNVSFAPISIFLEFLSN